ncbi:MAG: ankyrin repeat domain-containing protein [Thiobacillus sp.]|nr:ankyrin repeat domain-containing protein [Thiobacillus sp.]MDP2980206.1 ankyrin repeat domain-containing protein [Thiobacillus sp.]
MSYRDLHPADLQDLRAEPELLILDMRDPATYAQGRIEGAEPVSDALLRQLMKSRQRERPVLVYCYHGNSSRDLCQFIAGFGYARVYNLVGGWQGWLQFTQAPTAAPLPTTPSPNLAAWLAERGFPTDRLHARIDNGMSPLMLAALKGERALVEELLALGADPNHVNDDDHHALWFACVHGDSELVSLLIAHGAHVDNQNVNGATCAIYTASTGKLDVLKRLVEAGANLDKETSGGYTALDSASTLPVLRYLRGVVTAAA